MRICRVNNRAPGALEKDPLLGAAAAPLLPLIGGEPKCEESPNLEIDRDKNFLQKQRAAIVDLSVS